MAEVFAGSSAGAHGFQKQVAIKRLLPELANDHVFVERLISEAKLVVGMQHGNIVSVLDLAREGDDVFLVMEFVDGPSLRQLLKTLGTRALPFGVSTYIIQAAAAGLEFAHARPGGAVIHADISPSNVLLTTAGEVRVADFGIARREGASSGSVEGKWAYMAPEQARSEPLTPRSDVYSLGVVLYEIITGQHPFGLQITPTQHGPAQRSLIPPLAVNPLIPPGLDQICMRALAYDPRDRFPRMQNMIDALVDERFGNGFREGASDLARVIRDTTPIRPVNTDTQVTRGPLTIFTHSLIGSAMGSSPMIDRRAIQPPIAQTPSHPQPQVAMMPPPEMRPTQLGVLPPQQFVAAAMMQRPSLTPHGYPPAVAGSEEISSTYGGSPMTASGVPRNALRWTVSVLGVATALGVVAAVAVHEPQPAEDDVRAAAAEPQPAPAAQTDTANAPAPLPAPTPTIADPAPAPVADPAPTVAQPVAPPPTTPSATQRKQATPHPTGKQSGSRVTSRDKSMTSTATSSRRDEGREPRESNDAVLRIRAIPNSIEAKITIENEETMLHGEVPGGKFTLTPGKYKVILSNQDLDLWVDCKTVIVEPGNNVLKVNMKDRDCWTDR